MQNRTLVSAVASLVVGSVLLSGCVTTEERRPDSAVGQLQRLDHLEGAPTVMGIRAEALDGVTFSHDVALLPRYYIRWITFPEDEAGTINAAVRQDVSARVSEFVGRSDGYESTTEYMAKNGVPEVLPQLHLRSDITALSNEVIGLRLTTIDSPNSTIMRNFHTHWFDVSRDQMVGTREMFDDDDAWMTVTSLIQDQLDAHPDVMDAIIADLGWLEFFDSVNFTAEGDAVVEFDEYAISTASSGVIEVRIPSDQIQVLLSDFGKRAQRAAMDPVLPGFMQANAGAHNRVSAPTVPSTDTPATATRGPNCERVKCVALTFEDGPGERTEEVLDLLEEHDAKATFFVMGPNVILHPEAVLRMHRDGHEIGNHTWNHPQLTSATPDRVKSELERTAKAVRDTVGEPPTVTRVPYGAINDSVSMLLTTPSIMWSLDSQDWRHHSETEIFETVTADAEPGSIVLMHDVLPDTVDALPEILDYFAENDYELVTASHILAGEEPAAGVNYYRGESP